MKLDRWLALIFLSASLIYGFAAFNYQLLPFERNMAFLPNTLPKGLSILGSLISLFILLAPARQLADDAGISGTQVREFELLRTIGLIIAMVLYALLLRPVGFLLATSLFIIGSSVLLGERRWHILVPVALLAAGLVWYLVHQTLGIFLRPWPAFIH